MTSPNPVDNKQDMAKKKAPAKKKTLTSLQKKFCDILILMEISGKVTQAEAYKLAGSKCTRKTLDEEASKTRRKPQVLAYLSRARARVRSAVDKTEAEIITQFEKLGFSELTDFVSWGPNGIKLKTSLNIPKNKIAALKSITIDEHEYTNKKGKEGNTRQIKVELHSPKGALDSLAKIKGMMKTEITGPDGGPIPMSIVDFEKINPNE